MSGLSLRPGAEKERVRPGRGKLSGLSILDGATARAPGLEKAGECGSCGWLRRVLRAGEAGGVEVASSRERRTKRRARQKASGRKQFVAKELSHTWAVSSHRPHDQFLPSRSSSRDGGRLLLELVDR